MSYKPLGDIVTVKGGKRLPKGCTLQEEKNTHPYIRVRDMGTRYIPRTGLEFVPDDVFPKISRYIVNTNDVIISIVGTIGLVSVIDDYFDNASQTENCAKLSGLDQVDALFLYYFLRSKEGQAEIKMGTVGAVQAKLPLYNIEKINVYWPERITREKIVGQLSSLDEKLELNTQTNQTLEQIAQALFKSWFVDFDPVKAKISVLEAGGTAEEAELAAMSMIAAKSPEQLAELKQAKPDAYEQLAQTAALFPSAMQESELGEIPEGWKTLPLDKVAHYQNGLALQKFRPQNENDYLPVVKIAQLKKGFADGEEKASPNIKPECIIDNGDVIFSWSGSLVVDIWCGGKAALNQHLFKVTSEQFPKWLYHYFTKHHLAEFQRIAADKAVTMGHIKREHLSSAKCAIASDEIISKGSELIGSVLEKQIEQRLESNILAETRDAILPELLTGTLSKQTLAKA